MIVKCESHPLLHAIVFETSFSKPIGEIVYNDKIESLMIGKLPVKVNFDDSLVKSVRNMMRYGGFKPAGRSKPSSEYLHKLIETSVLPKVNIAVDIGNIVSCYSGIPLSVVDKSKIDTDCDIRIGMCNEKYVFNQSGQEIDLSGLILLSDVNGPFANPVKDSMRSKTNESTRETITILWGTNEIVENVNNAYNWFIELISISDCDATVSKCSIV